MDLGRNGRGRGRGGGGRGGGGRRGGGFRHRHRRFHHRGPVWYGPAYGPEYVDESVCVLDIDGFPVHPWSCPAGPAIAFEPSYGAAPGGGEIDLFSPKGALIALGVFATLGFLSRRS